MTGDKTEPATERARALAATELAKSLVLPLLSMLALRKALKDLHR